jgi:hypothetical protein
MQLLFFVKGLSPEVTKSRLNLGNFVFIPWRRLYLDAVMMLQVQTSHTLFS